MRDILIKTFAILFVIFIIVSIGTAVLLIFEQAKITLLQKYFFSSILVTVCIGISLFIFYNSDFDDYNSSI